MNMSMTTTTAMSNQEIAASLDTWFPDLASDVQTPDKVTRVAYCNGRYCYSMLVPTRYKHCTRKHQQHQQARH